MNTFRKILAITFFLPAITLLFISLPIRFGFVDGGRILDELTNSVTKIKAERGEK